MRRTYHIAFLYLALFTAIGLNSLLWLQARHVRGVWLNVPPVPSEFQATGLTIGDKQFAYRFIGIMLQNLGDTGGRVTATKDYDFKRLSEWFFLADKLDPQSNFVPYLAAYYFSVSQEPEKIRPLLDYLEYIGNRPDGIKWRWLAQAVVLARFNLKDMDRALELANKLAAIDNPAMPPWTRQMPAFILNARGEKQASYELMMGLLEDSKNLPREEFNAMAYYICKRILDETQARGHPLCQGTP